jgi:AcrR family transcriptional regulator
MSKQTISPEPSPKPRDRDATARAIVQAAKEVLGEDGFQAFGVNAIARRAGCDKQLIYRYFGGLEGLADAIGADLAEQLSEELMSLAIGPPARTYAELMEHLAFGLLELLLRNRLMQQINAWESSMPSPLVKRLVEARSRRLGAWMQEMRGELTPPKGVDAGAVNAVLIAAIQQLVLSSSASGEFAGASLKSNADWRRIKTALSTLVRAVYG